MDKVDFQAFSCFVSFFWLYIDVNLGWAFFWSGSRTFMSAFGFLLSGSHTFLSAFDSLWSGSHTFLSASAFLSSGFHTFMSAFGFLSSGSYTFMSASAFLSSGFSSPWSTFDSLSSGFSPLWSESPILWVLFERIPSTLDHFCTPSGESHTLMSAPSKLSSESFFNKKSKAHPRYVGWALQSLYAVFFSNISKRNKDFNVTLQVFKCSRCVSAIFAI